MVEGNSIAILALPVCPMVSPTNAYQMELKMGKVLLMTDRIIYVQMEFYTVMYRDITNFNEKPHESEVVASYFPSCVLYLKVIN